MKLTVLKVLMITFIMSINAGLVYTEIIVPGNNLTEKLAWLQRSADSHNTYIIEVNANENIEPHNLIYRGAINITIIMRGDEENRTIRLRSHGTMFTVSPDVTFILENNTTLRGHNQNTGHIINIVGGTFIMNNGATITGNARGIDRIGGGGVEVSSGSFEMNGGTISGNSGRNGGGVYLNNGTFTMNDGNIIGNDGFYGAGIVIQLGTFNMIGGSISNNTNTGVHVSGAGAGGIFNMRGGTISGNTGSGVTTGGRFTMTGGLITGNTGYTGAGVFASGGTFTKTGGTITGYNSDQANGNVVRDEAGNVLARRGHAVFVNENLRKETTSGPEENLSNRDTGRWD